MTLAEYLPPEHLARFVVTVIALLDLSAIYAHYAPRGGEPYAPEILLGLLFYGYKTGVFSSRKLEKATYESIPFRFIAGGLHPDHDTLASFRQFSLRGLAAAAGEWCLVCLAFNLKRLHSLLGGQLQILLGVPTLYTKQSGWIKTGRKGAQKPTAQTQRR